MAAAPINLVPSPNDAVRGWAELIRRAGTGDPRALGQLYDQTSRLVYGLAQRILANFADAEEVTSDVYSYVWRSASTFDESRGSALSWLMVLTRSRALDRVRARAQSSRRLQSIDAASTVPASGANAEAAASLSERSGLVRRALEDLPPEQRELLELAYFGGLSHVELAAQSGLPLGTVKTRIRMGMTKLRARLAQGEVQQS
jgi:RNA polymerase sigma-70 factor (ECF subfamily)